MLETAEAIKRLRALTAAQNGAQRTGGPLGSVGAVKRARSTHAGTQGNPKQCSMHTGVELGKRLPCAGAGSRARRRRLLASPLPSEPHWGTR